MTAPLKSVRVHDASFDRDDGTVLVWRDIDGMSDTGTLPSPGGGSRDAALLIELGVDGQFTTVYGEDADRAAIARAVSELTELLGYLDSLYPADQPRGKCLEHGDWGRCGADDGHEGDHHFPTEAQWRALNPPKSPAA